MDEEILIDKENNINYLERLVSQNMFLIMLIVIVVISALLFWKNAYMNGNSSCAITERNPQEIESFNSQFTFYGGTQTGAKLKSMIGTAIANSNIDESDTDRLPTVIVKNDENKIEIQAYCIKESSINGIIECSVYFYINNLSLIRNRLINKNKYLVEFDYTEKGLINSIIITGTINSLNEEK